MTGDDPLPGDGSELTSSPETGSGPPGPEPGPPAGTQPQVVLDQIQLPRPVWEWLEAEANELGVDPRELIVRLVQAAAGTGRSATGRHSAASTAQHPSPEQTHHLDAEIDRRLAALSEDWRQPPPD